MFHDYNTISHEGFLTRNFDLLKAGVELHNNGGPSTVKSQVPRYKGRPTRERRPKCGLTANMILKAFPWGVTTAQIFARYGKKYNLTMVSAGSYLRHYKRKLNEQRKAQARVSGVVVDDLRGKVG